MKISLLDKIAILTIMLFLTPLVVAQADGKPDLPSGAVYVLGTGPYPAEVIRMATSSVNKINALNREPSEISAAIYIFGTDSVDRIAAHPDSGIRAFTFARNVDCLNSQGRVYVMGTDRGTRTKSMTDGQCW